MKKNLGTFLFAGLLLLFLTGCLRNERRWQQSDTSPEATPIISHLPTADSFWDQWNEMESDLGEWLNSDPTVSADEIPSDTSPEATPSIVPLPTADSFWDQWDDMESDLGEWLNADPTVSADYIP